MGKPGVKPLASAQRQDLGHGLGSLPLDPQPARLFCPLGAEGTAYRSSQVIEIFENRKKLLLTPKGREKPAKRKATNHQMSAVSDSSRRVQITSAVEPGASDMLAKDVGGALGGVPSYLVSRPPLLLPG